MADTPSIPTVEQAAPPTGPSANRDGDSWQYPNINRQFTLVTFATPPIAGSLVSFLYNGGALWCLLEVARGRYLLPRERFFVGTSAALYAYSLAMILAALVNPNLGDSLLQLVGVVSLMLFPFSYTIWRVSRKDDIMRACMLGCAIACFGGLLEAMLQIYFLSYARADGGAANPLVFANVVALAGGVALVGAFSHDGRKRLFYMAAFLASIGAIIFSASRGPLLLVVANTIIVSFVHARGRGMRFVLVMAAGAVAILALMIASGLSPLPQRLFAMFDNWNDMAEHGNFSSSVGIRIALWQIGVDLWLQKPFLGHGAGNLAQLISVNLSEQYGISRGFSHFHNVFLNTLVEGGLLALGGLIAMIVIPVAAAFHALSTPGGPSERFGATLLLIVFTMFLITGMTNLVLRHDIMDAVLLTSLVVGLYLAVGTSQAPREGATIFS